MWDCSCVFVCFFLHRLCMCTGAVFYLQGVGGGGANTPTWEIRCFFKFFKVLFLLIFISMVRIQNTPM